MVVDSAVPRVVHICAGGACSCWWSSFAFSRARAGRTEHVQRRVRSLLAIVHPIARPCGRSCAHPSCSFRVALSFLSPRCDCLSHPPGSGCSSRPLPHIRAHCSLDTCLFSGRGRLAHYCRATSSQLAVLQLLHNITSHLPILFLGYVCKCFASCLNSETSDASCWLWSAYTSTVFTTCCQCIVAVDLR